MRVSGWASQVRPAAAKRMSAVIASSAPPARKRPCSLVMVTWGRVRSRSLSCCRGFSPGSPSGSARAISEVASHIQARSAWAAK